MTKAQEEALRCRLLEWLQSAPEVPERDLSEVVDGGGFYYTIAPMIEAQERLEHLIEHFHGNSIDGQRMQMTIKGLLALMYWQDPNAGQRLPKKQK